MINKKEKIALLVGVNLNESEYDFNESMEELEELSYSTGIEEVYHITQNRDKIDSTFFIGKGKIDEIKNFIEINNIDIVIFNDELSGSQLNNIVEKLSIKVIDRPTLILDIFANRAKSKISKLQIELAQLNYRLPRLKGFGESMSRLGAGIGTRGPGEQKLEMDRRRIYERISDIKKRLDKMKTVREIQRKKRVKSSLPIVSMVGYSNVGKSTLLNALEKINVLNDENKEVYVDDMLFATLDTHSRLITSENKKNFILNDTIGFVSKLPHFLIEAFKGTLEEIKTSDLILHVVDSKSESIKKHMEVTNKILNELGCGDIPKLVVYNKVDLLNDNNFEGNEIKISALKELNLDVLVDKIQSIVYSSLREVVLLIDYNNNDVASFIFNKYSVEFKKYVENGVILKVDLDEEDYMKYKKFMYKGEIDEL